MKERPILFSAPMVRAVLDGSKTQTRRIVKPQPPRAMIAPRRAEFSVGGHDYRCPYGQPGDRLWVRETWALLRGIGSAEAYRGIPPVKPTAENPCAGLVPVPIYAADGERPDVMEPHFETMRPMRWKPSIHMPRWASRITLEVTGVRVERLQDISEEDANAEGVEPRLVSHDADLKSYKLGFKDAWRDIYGLGSWNAHPWVWVVEFKRV